MADFQYTLCAAGSVLEETFLTESSRRSSGEPSLVKDNVYDRFEGTAGIQKKEFPPEPDSTT